jgi:hypothetical protein
MWFADGFRQNRPPERIARVLRSITMGAVLVNARTAVLHTTKKIGSQTCIREIPCFT